MKGTGYIVDFNSSDGLPPLVVQKLNFNFKNAVGLMPSVVSSGGSIPFSVRYEDLPDKPSIGGVVVSGSKNFSDYGLVDATQNAAGLMSPADKAKLDLLEPVGSVIEFAGSTVPSGYLECDGSAVSRSEYSSLFAVIGTTWGAGDGSTTFNLPDLSGDAVLMKIIRT